MVLPGRKSGTGGVVVVNKPAGITSFGVVSLFSEKFGVKAGHCGTLDRFAEGVLILCWGRATKFVGYLMQLPKLYEAEGRFGMTTDTYDEDGKVVSGSEKVPSSEQIANIVSGFVGEIEQTPPPYSAKKIRGKRASDYIRQGKAVSLKPRKVRIYEIEILNYDYPHLRIRLRCSSGTYVRSVINDIGRKAGCGAYTRKLIRLSVGKFNLENAISLQQIEAMQGSQLTEISLSPGSALNFMPVVVLTEGQSRRFLNGQLVRIDCGESGLSSPVRVEYKGGAFLGVGRIIKGALVAEKVYISPS